MFSKIISLAVLDSCQTDLRLLPFRARDWAATSQNRSFIVYLSVPSQGLGLYPNKDPCGLGSRADRAEL